MASRKRQSFEPERKVTVQSALKAAQTLQDFLERNGDENHQQSLLHLQCLITESMVGSIKQAKITDFFKK